MNKEILMDNLIYVFCKRLTELPSLASTKMQDVYTKGLSLHL